MATSNGKKSGARASQIATFLRRAPSLAAGLVGGETEGSNAQASSSHGGSGERRATLLRSGYMLKCDFKRAAQRAARRGRVAFKSRNYTSRWFELFSDCTLKYKQRKDSSAFKGEVDLSLVTAVELSRISDAPELALDLVTSVGIAYTVSPNSAEEQAAWQSALRKLLPEATHEEAAACVIDTEAIAAPALPLRPSPSPSNLAATAAATAAVAAVEAAEQMSEASRAKRAAKRQHIGAEFINYERHYVDLLDSFLASDGVIGHLEVRDTAVKREFLQDPDIALVLSNLKQILVLDKTLLRNLELAATAPAAAAPEAGTGTGTPPSAAPAQRPKVRHIFELPLPFVRILLTII